MISAALLFAAIITQQNDLYTTTADYATFSSNSTGIASRWIPYGTYTDGTGGTEYLRVTSNLIGVVASVFDGYEERSYLPGEYLPEDLGNMRYIYYPPPQRSGYFRDGGEYLQTTNNTRRILDFYGATSYINYFKEGTNYSYNVGSGSDAIEARLAQTIESWGEFYNGGLASYYGGRKLDALVEESGDTAPPISTTWGTDVPFKVADIDRWAQCWPTYSALTNDVHFFPAVSGKVQRCDRPFIDWGDPNHLVEVWGQDVNEAVTDVATNTLPIPLPFNMEDVLSVDTGWKYEVPPVETGSWWTVSGPLGNFRLGAFYDFSPSFLAWDNWEKPYPTNYYVEIGHNLDGSNYSLLIYDAPTGEQLYYDSVVAGEDDDTIYFSGYSANRTRLYADRDDYKHWRNDTTRLDWKRLGITCQLERQMETTYRARDGEDYLPFQRTTAARTHVYEGVGEVSFVDGSGDIVASTNLNPQLVSFHLVTQVVECASTNFGWCFPTARLEGSYEIGDLRSVSGAGGVEVYAPVSLFEGIFQSLGSSIAQAHSFTDGKLGVEISGTFSANGLTSFVWPWVVDFADFWPNDGGDSSQVYPSISGTETIAVSMTPTNAVFNLVMSVGKRAATMQTDETAQAETITNLVAYPMTNIWARSWVGEQERPSLEVMIDAKGFEFEDYAHQYGDETMDWDDIKAETNKTRRVFRMAPLCAPKGTRDLSDLNRWQMLADLDGEVKTRFATLAGMGVGVAAQNLVNFAAGEENALKAQLQAQRLNVGMALAPDAPPPPWLVVYGLVDIDQNGTITGANVASIFFFWNQQYEGEEQTWKYLDPTPSGYLVGHLTFTVGSASLTNQLIDVKPVRVDGHQDQMIKTLWKFKNLRDSSL